MAFELSVEFISSFAYFVEHLDVLFKPSEIYSDENNRKIIEAINYLYANDTKHILKKVSSNVIHAKVTYYTKLYTKHS